MQRCQDLDFVCQNLPSVLQLLTNVSLESMAELIQDGEDSEQLMLKHRQRLSEVCAQVQVDEDKLKPRWNKTYGVGGTCWAGALQDNRSRGGIPYYCPSGWVRFSLDVGADKDFETKFKDWGYLYHGTKGKFVGSIMTAGLRASQGLCYCGAEDHAVYMSPSIEYCGHPRYSRIEYNPESKHWIQVVLQCRVNPEALWKKCRETLACSSYAIDAVDPNFNNDDLEWLFKPNHQDPVSQHMYLKDAIVCTGIMVRVTKEHPNDGGYWWSQDRAYLEYWNLLATRVDPEQPRVPTSAWTKHPRTTMCSLKMKGHPTDDNFKCKVEDEVDIGDAYMSPLPFANGSMRFAYYMSTDRGMYVVKEYNVETKRHIEDVLASSEHDMLMRDVQTYMAAKYYAKLMNRQAIGQEWANWTIRFVQPVLFRVGNKTLFGEPLIKGEFLKWNNNAGGVNNSDLAKKEYMDRVANTFSHFTYHASGGKLIVVDVQGWDMRQSVMFTDPQIHTRSSRCDSTRRREDRLLRRFSVGNFGKTGMVKFFMSHRCTSTCLHWKLVHPIVQKDGVAQID